ncbi:MAG: hypothetical protein ABI867_39160 [Kofleriaceae bacterium]
MRLLLVVALLGCKVDETAPAQATKTGSAPSSDALTMPSIPGAKQLATKRREHDVFASWCIDEQDAIARVMTTLRDAGWTDVRTRGTGERIGIAATRGDVRFSATTGGRDANCAGTYVTATVMRLGDINRPPP